MKLEELDTIIQTSLSLRDSLTIEITTTQACNCQCKYCFEGSQASPEICASRDKNEEKRQLDLISRFCKNFDVTKNDTLVLTFWGGEPMMNDEFVQSIIEQTINYDFVKYYMYTNGTLLERIKCLIEKFPQPAFKRKMHFQLSYDGEPHNLEKRGKLSSEKVLETARFLNNQRFSFSFKATLSFDMLKYLPEIWKSYEKLFHEFGANARYSPTLDMSEVQPNPQQLQIWRDVLVEVAKLELQFYKKYGFTLMKHFEHGSRRICNPTKSIMMHNDGKFYLCHGCAYLKDTKGLSYPKSTLEVSSLDEVFAWMEDIVDLSIENENCKACPATWCTTCHANYVDPSYLREDWIACVSRSQTRCQYMKVFGMVRQALGVNIIRN